MHVCIPCLRKQKKVLAPFVYCVCVCVDGREGGKGKGGEGRGGEGRVLVITSSMLF